MEAKEYAWMPLPSAGDEAGAASGRMDGVAAESSSSPLSSSSQQLQQQDGFPFGRIALYVALWSGFYYFLQYANGRKGSEWNCRIVTCVHASLITALSIYSAFILGPSPLTDPGVSVNTWEWHTTTICLGYFIYDLVWCLYHQSEGTLILVHHIASIVCLLLPLNLGVSGGEVVVSIAAMEITNPLLQLRWFLRESGYKDALVTTVVDVVFITLFFVMRMVFGTYLLYCVASSPRPYFVIKLGGASFCLISYIFQYHIFRYVYRKYVLGGKRGSARECADPCVDSCGSDDNGVCGSGGGNSSAKQDQFICRNGEVLLANGGDEKPKLS